jgi:hypothetical protein
MVVLEKTPPVVHDFEDTVALCHSDISLAYLASFGALPESMPQLPLHYFAMCWISLYNFSAKNGIDLDLAVRIKQKYNETRPHRHGGKKI